MDLIELQRPHVQSTVDACLHLSQRTLINKLDKQNLININWIYYFQRELSSPDRRNAIQFLQKVFKSNLKINLRYVKMSRRMRLYYRWQFNFWIEF